MSEWPDTALLGTAREWLREQAMEQGAKCPCCTQFTKVYRRSIHSAMARGLVAMWNAGDRASLLPVFLPELVANSGDPAKLRYWGLIAEEQGQREDGGPTGWYRVTELGDQFVRRMTRVPKYAYVFDGRCLKLEGDPVSISDCLGKRFDLAELMALNAPVESAPL